MGTESNVRKAPPPPLNVSLPITACVFACAVLLTVVVVNTIRRRRERRRFIITPFCCKSASLPSSVTHPSPTTQLRQRPSTAASEMISPSTESSVTTKRSSMCKSPTTAVPYTVDIQNSIPPPLGTLVDTTLTLPEHPPLLRTRTTSNHRQPRKLGRADVDVKEKIMITMYGFGQDRTSFLPRYQVRPDFESDPLASPSVHRPPPAYQV
ncbi:hypothetical protein M378DRAFT_592517 [Amanita muscaria Koide BX008]|uniref:Uncharacterized protein n=1 Tax=Amanita muscaria (strain Koide BX008) TaxID=946122 RepID=A0A0C2X6E4_AMAMK|nr:hypothetical protein M378DRAFT_592517 [Amanita muscaria Koide BX008]